MVEAKSKKAVVVGRKGEVRELNEAWNSSESELIAIYGRRRIGKTYLIRNALLVKSDYLEVTGLKDGSMTEQLDIFRRAFQEKFYKNVQLQPFDKWQKAFEALTTEVKRLKKSKKFVLFLDELPWLATQKSGLLQALDHYFNSEWSKLSNFKVVLCGSAASWMLENLIHAKGGLHNRITRDIPLQPFSLSETEEYLRTRNIRMNRDQTLELYMALGGVAHYLKQVKRGKSASQVISELCFSKKGILREEYDKLFPALFKTPQIHFDIFKIIASKRNGIDRNELLKRMKVSSGGTLNRWLRELEQAGFIGSFIPYGHKKKETFYRAMDEYCYFYEKWIDKAPKGILGGAAPKYWEKKRNSSAWRSWSGYTFEGICLKHAENIQKALGFQSDNEVGSWRFVPPKGSKEKGAQVDLLFDRVDGVIDLCEIKYSNGPFTIDKTYAAELERKIAVFKKKTGTKKQIHLIFITTHGVTQNMYYGRLVDDERMLDALF